MDLGVNGQGVLGVGRLMATFGTLGCRLSARVGSRAVAPNDRTHSGQKGSPDPHFFLKKNFRPDFFQKKFGRTKNLT